MNASVGQKSFVGGTMLLAVLGMVGGLLIILGIDQLDVGGDVAKYSIGTTVFLAGPLALAGLWASKRRPSLGAACQVGGAAIFGVCFSWTIVGPILALLVAVFGVRRARRLSKEQALKARPEMARHV